MRSLKYINIPYSLNSFKVKYTDVRTIAFEEYGGNTIFIIKMQYCNIDSLLTFVLS